MSPTLPLTSPTPPLTSQVSGANEAQEEVIGEQAGDRVLLFLETYDFETDYAIMRRAGILFLEEPREETYGMVVKWVDPFGNKWDLIERY